MAHGAWCMVHVPSEHGVCKGALLQLFSPHGHWGSNSPSWTGEKETGESPGVLGSTSLLHAVVNDKRHSVSKKGEGKNLYLHQCSSLTSAFIHPNSQFTHTSMHTYIYAQTYIIPSNTHIPERISLSVCVCARTCVRKCVYVYVCLVSQGCSI